MYKKKILFLFSIIVLSTLPALGQKELRIIEKEPDLSNIITSDSAVVQIKSTVLLSFDSNTDDPGFDSKPNMRDGLYVYELKFPTGKKAYQLRELKIESDGFLATMYSLHNLKAKDRVNLFIVDNNVWNCYVSNLKNADDLFALWQYDKAAVKYEETLDCGYEPEKSNLKKRIKYVHDCADAKFMANYNYDDRDYIWAKEKYEELYGLNPNDTFAKERIAACQIAEEKRIAELKAEEERKLTEQKLAEEKKLAEQKAKEEKEIAERKAKEEQLRAEAEEKRLAELKAAEEKRLSELKAEEERKLTEQKVAEEKKLAELKAKEEKEIAERKAKEEQLRAEAEEKRLAEQKAQEEQRKIEEEKKHIQQRAKTFFERIPNTIELLSSGGTKTFDINDYETPWEISNIPSWCSIEKKDDLLILNCEPNTNTNIRESSFEVRVGGLYKKVVIKQNKRISLNVSHSHIEFGNSGGKDTLTISTDASTWKASDIPSWCTSIQKGKSLIITCTANPNTSLREGNFYVQAGDQSVKITITQKAKIFLELSDQIIKFGKSGGKNNLTVSTNASSWSISNEMNWCSTIISNNSISFFCDTNSTAQERSGTLTIIAGNESKTIKITQIDISNLEKGYWKQVLKNAISYRSTTYTDALFKGSQNGLGVYYWPSTKQSYWGELQNKQSNGKGIHILGKDDMSFPGCPNCRYYAGNWSSDEINGLGKCYDKTGELIYSDLFYKAKPVEKFPQSYDGSKKFKCIEYENGDIYLGETYKGLRDGLGIFFWENGDTWYGEWKDDKRNGNGIEYPYDGVFKAGQWEDENEVPIQSFRKNLEQKPAIVVSSPKYTNKGSKVYLNETVVPINEVRELMANTTTLQLYDKGILYNKTGNYLLYSGGALFVVGLCVGVPMANSSKISTAGGIITGIACGTGAATIISGAVLKIFGIKKIENSVNMYNKTKSAHAELKCGFTGNGVGVTLGF